MKSVKILVGRGSRTCSPFVEKFVEACRRGTFAAKQDILIHRKLRALLGRMLSFNICKVGGRVLVCGGHRIESPAWPWCYFHEIIPVMWDVWPANVKPLVRYVRRNRIQTLFCTSSMQVDVLKQLLPRTNVVWIPEGIDVGSYPQGESLASRKIDVLEYGRSLGWVHEKLVEQAACGTFTLRYQKGKELQFPDFDSLKAGIRSAKMAVCYPMCDTTPQKAGNVETLTQRYWECMLSGTIPIGRAPRELVNLCGYNPVVEMGDDPCSVIRHTLGNLDSAQELVNKNRACAERIAGWENRLSVIQDALGVFNARS